jgi:hypothetical protein
MLSSHWRKGSSSGFCEPAGHDSLKDKTESGETCVPGVLLRADDFGSKVIDCSLACCSAACYHFFIVIIVVILAIEVILISQKPRHAWQLARAFPRFTTGASSNYGDRTGMAIYPGMSPATPSHIQESSSRNQHHPHSRDRGDC